MNFIVRKSCPSDLDALLDFFKSAYGNDSALANESYLKWFFFNNGAIFQSSYVAIFEKKIVAHYGLLKTIFTNGINEYVVNFGVSSYTLEEYRGLGISTEIFNQIIKNEDNLAVVGFTPKTKSFYETKQFNLHDSNRFERFLKITNTREFTKICNINLNKFNSSRHKIETKIDEVGSIVNITTENIESFNFNFNYNFLTTKRDSAYLRWRFLDCPFSEYKLFGYIKENEISSLIVVKIEFVNENMFCLRLVDVFGELLELKSLLINVENDLINKNCLFIDYIHYQNIYGSLFVELNYSHLAGDSFAEVPFYTNPISFADNNEYFGIHAENQNLKFGDFYLTKMNSDRDRLNKL